MLSLKMISQPYLVWEQVRSLLIGRITLSTHQKWPHPNKLIWTILGWIANMTWVHSISFQILSQVWKINTNVKIRILQGPLPLSTASPYQLPREITHREIAQHLHSTTKWTKMHLTHLQTTEESPIVWELEFKLTFSAPTWRLHPDLTIQINIYLQMPARLNPHKNWPCCSHIYVKNGEKNNCKTQIPCYLWYRSSYKNIIWSVLANCISNRHHNVKTLKNPNATYTNKILNWFHEVNELCNGILN